MPNKIRLVVVSAVRGKFDSVEPAVLVFAAPNPGDTFPISPRHQAGRNTKEALFKADTAVERNLFTGNDGLANSVLGHARENAQVLGIPATSRREYGR
jgi:hypothetical protein